MCHPVLLLASAVGGVGAGVAIRNKQEQKKRKAEAATQARIDAVKQEYEQRIEANKIANQTQSTEELQNPTLAQKLKEQKVPLNTSNTGATVGTPTTVGLNLGGY